jgi:hypothetical protein
MALLGFNPTYKNVYFSYGYLRCRHSRESEKRYTTATWVIHMMDHVSGSAISHHRMEKE